MTILVEKQPPHSVLPLPVFVSEQIVSDGNNESGLKKEENPKSEVELIVSDVLNDILAFVRVKSLNNDDSIEDLICSQDDVQIDLISLPKRDNLRDKKSSEAENEFKVLCDEINDCFEAIVKSVGERVDTKVAGDDELDDTSSSSDISIEQITTGINTTTDDLTQDFENLSPVKIFEFPDAKHHDELHIVKVREEVIENTKKEIVIDLVINTDNDDADQQIEEFKSKKSVKKNKYLRSENKWKGMSDFMMKKRSILKKQSVMTDQKIGAADHHITEIDDIISNEDMIEYMNAPELHHAEIVRLRNIDELEKENGGEDISSSMISSSSAESLFTDKDRSTMESIIDQSQRQSKIMIPQIKHRHSSAEDSNVSSSTTTSATNSIRSSSRPCSPNNICNTTLTNHELMDTTGNVAVSTGSDYLERRTNFRSLSQRSGLSESESEESTVPLKNDMTKNFPEVSEEPSFFEYHHQPVIELTQEVDIDSVLGYSDDLRSNLHCEDKSKSSQASVSQKLMMNDGSLDLSASIRSMSESKSNANEVSHPLFRMPTFRYSTLTKSASALNNKVGNFMSINSLRKGNSSSNRSISNLDCSSSSLSKSHTDDMSSIKWPQQETNCEERSAAAIPTITNRPKSALKRLNKAIQSRMSKSTSTNSTFATSAAGLESTVSRNLNMDWLGGTLRRKHNNKKERCLQKTGTLSTLTKANSLHALSHPKHEDEEEVLHTQQINETEGDGSMRDELPLHRDRSLRASLRRSTKSLLTLNYNAGTSKLKSEKCQLQHGGTADEMDSSGSRVLSNRRKQHLPPLQSPRKGLCNSQKKKNAILNNSESPNDKQFTLRRFMTLRHGKSKRPIDDNSKDEHHQYNQRSWSVLFGSLPRLQRSVTVERDEIVDNSNASKISAKYFKQHQAVSVQNIPQSLRTRDLNDSIMCNHGIPQSTSWYIKTNNLDSLDMNDITKVKDKSVMNSIEGGSSRVHQDVGNSPDQHLTTYPRSQIAENSCSRETQNSPHKQMGRRSGRFRKTPPTTAYVFEKTPSEGFVGNLVVGDTNHLEDEYPKNEVSFSREDNAEDFMSKPLTTSTLKRSESYRKAKTMNMDYNNIKSSESGIKVENHSPSSLTPNRKKITAFGSKISSSFRSSPRDEEKILRLQTLNSSSPPSFTQSKSSPYDTLMRILK